MVDVRRLRSTSTGPGCADCRSVRAPRRTVPALLLAALALFSVTAASCGDSSTGIGLGQVSQADVTELIEAPATVTARAVATLTAPADGTLSSLWVSPGASVTAGQVLAVISSPSAQRRLDSANSALAALRTGGGVSIGRNDLQATWRRTDQQAAVAFTDAREAAARIAEPAVRDALLHQVDAAEHAYQQASATAGALVTAVQRGLAGVGQAMSALTTAQRAQAQAAVDLAQSTVDALTLRAPVSGIVQLGGAPTGGGDPSLAGLLGGAGAGGDAASALAAAAGAGAGSGSATGSGGAVLSGPGVDPAVRVGGLVGAGTAVLTVVDVSELGLLAEVDETDVLLVQAGVAGQVELDAAPGAVYATTVSSVDLLPSTAASGGVSYRVRLSLGTGRAPDGGSAATPRPGMSAVARLSVRSANAAAAVPASAVFNDQGRDTVWLVRDGKARPVPVAVGVAGPDLVQITSGVSIGDRIVVRGADRVRPDQELR